jgi:hypothetical protein
MKKPIVSVIMALTLSAWGVFALAQPQESAKEEKPTFYRLTPGVYVNGWPRLTVTYPKDWVERGRMPNETFRVSAPGPVPFPFFTYAPPAVPLGNLPPLDNWADFVASFFKQVAQDVTVISDKPSQLRDGTPARELELHMLLNGAPYNIMGLAAKKGDVVVNMGVGSLNGKIGEDLKAILYSIEFQPDKDKPVEVPPDVQEFLERSDNDVLSHDVAKVMAKYSDRYLNSGVRKGEMERILRQFIGLCMSIKTTTTDFVPAGDRAYLTGFIITNNLGTFQIPDTSIIKENGEWKWYGNQRDVAR